MKLWDQACSGVFRGSDAFKKSDSFKEYPKFDLVVKQIIYTYFKLELYRKKVVEKVDLPPFLSTWLDRSSFDCMFSLSQLKNSPSVHLQAELWQLECSRRFTPPKEVAFFQSLQSSGIAVEELDEFVGLEGERKARAMKKRETSDKKKLERWEEEKKKADMNDQKKLERLPETEKGRKKSSKRKVQGAVSQRATSEGGFKATVSRFSLTQERLLHCPPIDIMDLDSLPDVDDCILNMTLAEVLDLEDGPFPKEYEDIVAFLEKINKDIVALFNYFV